MVLAFMKNHFCTISGWFNIILQICEIDTDPDLMGKGLHFPNRHLSKTIIVAIRVVLGQAQHFQETVQIPTFNIIHSSIYIDGKVKEVSDIETIVLWILKDINSLNNYKISSFDTLFLFGYDVVNFMRIDRNIYILSILMRSKKLRRASISQLSGNPLRFKIPAQSRFDWDRKPSVVTNSTVASVNVRDSRI